MISLVCPPKRRDYTCSLGKSSRLELVQEPLGSSMNACSLQTPTRSTVFRFTGQSLRLPLSDMVILFRIQTPTKSLSCWQCFLVELCRCVMSSGMPGSQCTTNRCGKLLQAAILANVAVAVESLQAKHTQISARIRQVMAGLKFHDIPAPLISRVLDSIEYYACQRYGMQDQDTLAVFPYR